VKRPLLYQLGQLAGPHVRKARWYWQGLTGSDAGIAEAERDVGRDLAAAFRRSMPVVDDPSIRSLVDDLAATIGPHIADPHRRAHEITIVDAAEANAFALPGGFLFLTRPLIELVDRDRDALAFVVGHEIAHVVKQDPLHRVLGEQAISMALRRLRAGVLVSGWVGSTAGKLLQSAYSQDRELRADRLGLRLAQVAGFDARAAVHTLRRICADRDGLPTWFASHPPLQRRLENLQPLLER